MEIEYTTRFEIPFLLGKVRNKKSLEAEVEVNNWGNLAMNEFFECQLKIEKETLPVKIVNRVKERKDEYDEPIFTYYGQVSFDKNEAGEDWWALCSDSYGNKLDTMGDQEQYNLEVLRLIQPSLKALELESFELTDLNSIELSVQPTVINDNAVGNDVLLSGEGTISIEPL